MSSKTTISTASGKTLTLSVSAPVTLTAGETVTIAVTPATAVGVVQFYDFSGPKLVNIGYANKAPYELKWTVPTDRPSRILGVALALHNRPTEPTLHYPITVQPAVSAAQPQLSTPPASTTPTPTPTGTSGSAGGSAVKSSDASPAVGSLGKWPAIGACVSIGDPTCDIHDDASAAAVVALAVAAGITDLRAFGPTAHRSKRIDVSGWIRHINRVLSAGTVRLTLMIGPSEGNRSDDPLTEKDWEAVFADCAAIHAGVTHPELLQWELANEYNLWAYFNRHTKDGGKLCPDVVGDAIAQATAARKMLGKATVIGPSVGWGASTQIHTDTAAALVKAGLLQLVDVWNDHCYFAHAADLQAVLDAQDRLGIKRRCMTEVQPIGEQAQQILMLQQRGVMPCIYRLLPGSRTTGAILAGTLHDSAGKQNPAAMKLWGLAK